MSLEALRQVAAVFFVLAMLGIVFWMARRGRFDLRSMKAFTKQTFSKQGAASRVMHTERLVLTPQHILHCVRTGGNEFVLVTHPQGCTLLHNIAGKEGTQP